MPISGANMTNKRKGKIAYGENDKISTLSDILAAQPQLTQISGTMRLENYSEADSRAGITFKRK